MPTRSHASPVIAGVVTALVGFTSSFAVVLAGLRAVGANSDQAASGLLTLTLAFAALMAWFAWRTRTPLTFAWSTPGAALLVSAGAVEGGWAAATGAFAVTGLLLAATGLIGWLGRLTAAIPTEIAQAMLAGVLVNLCLAPVIAFADSPAAIAPVVLAWLTLTRFATRWAVPGALAAALGVIAVTMAREGTTVATADLVPHLA